MIGAGLKPRRAPTAPFPRGAVGDARKGKWMMATLTLKADAVREAPARGTDLTTRDLSWFSQRVERGRKEIFVEIVTITPEIAKRLLENNPNNRSISQRLVDTIAHDILHGQWKLNGETIIISKDGELNDGQTRLTAVIKSGLPIQSAVMFGVERSSRFTVDMGRARNAAQFLGMRNITQSNKMAAIARLHLILGSGQVFSPGYSQVTKQDVVRCFEENQDKFQIAYRECGETRFARSVGGSSFLPVAYHAIHAVDSIGCDLFFDALATGHDLERDDPILWLRAKLIEVINKKQRLRSEERLEFVLRYWNAWANGTKIKVPIKMIGKYPKILTSKPR